MSKSKKTARIIVIVACVIFLAIGYALIPGEDPIVETMNVLHQHTILCVEEIKNTGVDGRECQFMIEVSDIIFEGQATAWAKDMINKGHINAGNIHVVSYSISRYNDALGLLIQIHKNNLKSTI